jgi:hypothetical protein
MKLSEISADDVLVSTDQHGTSFYRVLRVCAVKVRVRHENGNETLLYPQAFDRKIPAEKVPELHAEGISV